TVQVSHRILMQWEIVIQVAEALESGFSFTEAFYGHDVDINSLHERLARIGQLASAGKLEQAAKLIEDYEKDKRIQDYYEDIPSTLKSSGFGVASGVMIVTIFGTWGVGSIFAAPAGAGAGATAGGAASTITAGGVAAGAGAAFLNALVFTTVHRGLS